MYPAWATAGEERRKYGKAKALGASDQTLLDKDETEGFLEARAMGGTIISPFSVSPFSFSSFSSPISRQIHPTNIYPSTLYSLNLIYLFCDIG